MSASDIGGCGIQLLRNVVGNSTAECGPFLYLVSQGSTVRLQPEARRFRIVRIVGLLWVVLVSTVYFFGR